jgi:hypothetical protein
LNDAEISDRTVVEPEVRSPWSRAQGRDDLKTERHGRGTGGTLPKKDRNTGGHLGIRIRMFLGLPDSGPDLLVRGTNAYPSRFS